jgi:hypothetical protein
MTDPTTVTSPRDEAAPLAPASEAAGLPPPPPATAEPPPPPPGPRSGPGEWFLRLDSLRAARESLTAIPAERRAALGLARAALELGDKTLEPVEPLRAGHNVALSLSLYREAAFWALRGNGAPGKTLAEALNRGPQELISFAAGGPTRLAALREALVQRSFVDSGALHPDELRRDAGEARAFGHALVEQARGAERRIEALRLSRLLRCVAAVALVCGLVVAISVGVARARLGPDLAAGKPFQTSSSYKGFTPGSHLVDGTETKLMFHTNEEKAPWVEYDLLVPTTVRSVDIQNRADCCHERAVPLVVEVSLDHNKWTEVARREETFRNLSLKFPPQQARYVRVHGVRRTWLHFQGMQVR